MTHCSTCLHETFIQNIAPIVYVAVRNLKTHYSVLAILKEVLIQTTVSILENKFQSLGI